MRAAIAAVVVLAAGGALAADYVRVDQVADVAHDPPGSDTNYYTQAEIDALLGGYGTTAAVVAAQAAANDVSNRVTALEASTSLWNGVTAAQTSANNVSNRVTALEASTSTWNTVTTRWVYVTAPSSNTAPGSAGEASLNTIGTTNWFYWYDPDAAGAGTGRWLRAEGSYAW